MARTVAQEIMEKVYEAPVYEFDADLRSVYRRLAERAQLAETDRCTRLLSETRLVRFQHCAPIYERKNRLQSALLLNAFTNRNRGREDDCTRLLSET